MRKIIDKVERYLIRTAVLCVIAIVVVQGMMTDDSLRLYLSWSERMEGQILDFPVNQTIENTNAVSKSSTEVSLTLEIEDFSALPEVIVLVNGKSQYKFSEAQIHVEANAGDTIEIDATHYNFPCTFKVSKCSENLSFPKKGQTFKANQSIVMVGKLIIK
jgi:hypothetical protein